MSFSIDTAFVKQFNATVYLQLQQKGARLRPTVTEESITGEEKFFEQVGGTSVQEVTTRHGDSPLISNPHDRRRATLRFFDTGDLIDNFDKVRMLIDPTSTYTQNLVYALGRAYDDVLLGATANPGEKNIGTFLDGTASGVVFGTAFTGKAAATSVTFPAGQKVAVNFGGTNVGLTVAKLIEGKRILKKGNVDLDMEQPYMCINAKGEADLLNTTQVTSADYNSIKALVGGDVNSFLGISFKRLERIPNDATSNLFPMYVKSGVNVAVGKEIQTEVDRRADKRFSWYVYACIGVGGVRMEEEKVAQIAGLL
jgi:hypothetical protein